MGRSKQDVASWVARAVTAVVLAAALPACNDRGPADAQTPTDPQPITLVTYNVLAEPRSAAQSPRIDALLKLLDQSDADIIALQEVTPWFLNRLQNADWTRPYNFTENNGIPAAPGALHIMAKFSIENTRYKPLPSRQGRGVLVVHLRVRGRRLAVATVHLDSFLKSGPIRAKQLDIVWQLLDDADDAILIGDYNFGDGEQPDTTHLNPHYTDAWTTLRPNERGYTWNMEKNLAAKTTAFDGEKSRRLDRVMIRSDHWKPTSIQIIGDTPLSGTQNRFPSDHFGLLTRIAPEK